MPTKPWYHKGLRFECTQCGECCRNHGDYAYVYMTDEEVERISDHLGLTIEVFLERHCEEADGWVTLRTSEPACEFLGKDSRCAIYPVRPKQCKTWPFWEENLRHKSWNGEVKDCCPGIGKGPLVPAEEVTRIARETEQWYEEN